MIEIEIKKSLMDEQRGLMHATKTNYKCKYYLEFDDIDITIAICNCN